MRVILSHFSSQLHYLANLSSAFFFFLTWQCIAWCWKCFAPDTNQYKGTKFYGAVSYHDDTFICKAVMQSSGIYINNYH